MKILAVIKKHGYTLEQVSTMLGLTKGSLSATINGSPNVKKLIDIALKIGCSPAEFFDDWYENEGKEMKRPDTQPEKMDVGHDCSTNGKQSPEPADLPFGHHELQQEQDAVPALMVGLVRCPRCGHGIRLFAAEGSACAEKLNKL